MKISTTLVLTATAGIVAFLFGRLNSGGNTVAASGVEERASNRPRPGASRTTKDGKIQTIPEKITSCTGITAEEARLLTSGERMEMLANGGLVYNSGNQQAVLIGLIGGLTKDEIQKAGDTLGAIQDRGNSLTQQVWDAFWKQWGRVDPARCLSFFGPGAVSKSSADARNVMSGWLETDPAGAYAWARGRKESSLEDAAAALAITSAAGGNLKQMRSDIAALPAESASIRHRCLQDYFDSALLSGAGSTVDSVYEELPESLRQAAWPVALRRMTMEDPKNAASWFEKNLDPSGWNSTATIGLADQLANDDPAGTTRWLVSLPGASEALAQGVGGHPLSNAFIKWRERDPVAASQWLDGQPAGAAWVTRLKIPGMEGAISQDEDDN